MASAHPTNQSPDEGDDTDAALFLALQQGNKSALAALYDATHG